MRKQVHEFEIGKRHLANMMGEDPEHFSQEDVDVSLADPRDDWTVVRAFLLISLVLGFSTSSVGQTTVEWKLMTRQALTCNLTNCDIAILEHIL